MDTTEVSGCPRIDPTRLGESEAGRHSVDLPGLQIITQFNNLGSGSALWGPVIFSGTVIIRAVQNNNGMSDEAFLLTC